MHGQMPEHSRIFIDGAMVFTFLLLAIIISILSYKYNDIRGKYLKYHNHYHKDDHLTVKREDVIPLRVRTYDYRLFNMLITVRYLNLTKEDLEWRNMWGIIKIKRIQLLQKQEAALVNSTKNIVRAVSSTLSS